MYDVVIAGGSIAGLLCGREIARRGRSVLVLEKSHEIGTPEHCGGMVSASGLEELGIIPRAKTLEHTIESAEIVAPGGKSILIDAKKQGVAVINRRELDKQVAQQAHRAGAEIRAGTAVTRITEDGVRTSGGEIGCRVVIDARGISSRLIRDNPGGIMQSTQYEICADWIRKGHVRICLDQALYPGFFAWVIPSYHGTGKIGVAGRQPGVRAAMESILPAGGGHSVIRAIHAPIWVGGPVKKFVSGRTVTVGDAAGQTKPTTAGGIYSCGMGGVFAGRAVAEYLGTQRQESLQEYQKNWNGKFGREFERQLLARRMLEKLDNAAINKLFESVTPEILADMARTGSFDFHTRAVLKLFGAGGSARAAWVILASQIKSLLS